MKMPHLPARTAIFPLGLVLALVVTACGSGTSDNGGAGGTSSGGSGGTSSGGSGGRASGGSGGSSAGGTAGSASGGSSAGGTTTTVTASGGVGGKSSGGAGGTASGGATGGSGGGAGGTSTTSSGGVGPGTGGNAGIDASAGHDGGPATGTGGRPGGTGGKVTLDASPGGSGGGGGYTPCSASPCIILPLGDSITHGLNSSDDAGYRSQLFKLAVAAGQNITFTGTLSNGPSQVSSKTFPKNHDGHDGWTIDPGSSQYDTNKNQGVSLLVATDKAFKTMPHIVLVHIGTNDLTSSSAKSTTADRLDSLITKIAGVAPDALIVVAKVIPLGYSSSDWDTYNSKIPGLVQAHAAKGQHVSVVDMSKLPSSQLNGVHPTDQGYASMASMWYDAIKDVLPK